MPCIFVVTAKIQKQRWFIDCSFIHQSHTCTRMTYVWLFAHSKKQYQRKVNLLDDIICKDLQTDKTTTFYHCFCSPCGNGLPTMGPSTYLILVRARSFPSSSLRFNVNHWIHPVCLSLPTRTGQPIYFFCMAALMSWLRILE